MYTSILALLQDAEVFLTRTTLSYLVCGIRELYANGASRLLW